MYGWRARIGLIIPSSNTTMEPEFWKMAPEGVSIHSARMRLIEVTPEALSEMHKDLMHAAQLLSDTNVDIIVFGCTSGSFLEGLGFDKQISDEIKSNVGVEAITTSTAVIDALKELELRKIVLATPYIEEINKKEVKFLEDNGIKVLKYKGLGILKNTEIGAQTPDVAYRLAKEVYVSEADGVFISCTNFRTIEILDVLEQDLGVPVISSNQATMWKTLKTLGIREKYESFGTLLRDFL